jgi:hypothetical protein
MSVSLSTDLRDKEQAKGEIVVVALHTQIRLHSLKSMISEVAC